MKLLNYRLSTLFAAGKYEGMVRLVAEEYGLPAPPFHAETLMGKRWCRVYIYEGDNCHYYDCQSGLHSYPDNLGRMNFSCITTF